MSSKHQKIEKKWNQLWGKAGVFEPTFAKAWAGKPDFKKAKKPFYNLMMFPYPSAEGLHIGSVRTFTGVDIYGRYKRMTGHDVFEPIGLDGFGIHSENFALKTKRHPVKLAKITEKNFYRQLEMIGNGFAWNERLQTYDPAYYRWTQWIFTEMFRRGLAYRKKQEVNWCPSCLTVLADEQVILARRGLGEVGSGECERCGTKVIRKELEQWFFRITNYAERLLNNLEKLDWSEKIKIAQRNWIGKSEGALIKFLLHPAPHTLQPALEVFTTRPDTLFGATFMVISPELAKSWLERGWGASKEVQKYVEESLSRRAEENEDKKEKTGIFSGVHAINPANREKIPVWISDYVLAGYGTGAVMAVPAHDERDYAFAKKFKLLSRKVVEHGSVLSVARNAEDIAMGAKVDLRVESECFAGEGKLINSGKFSGRDSEKAKWEITKFVGGKKKVQYRLRDWLISRQRYWGPPIPMIFCESCRVKGKGERQEMPGWYAVPARNLPVKLPFVKNFRPHGQGASPLASVRSFYEVKCPGCKQNARRETDVSDTFLDSAWYFLRYPSVKDKKQAWDPEITKKWLPVNMYIGGAEHAVLHLLYSRFLTMAFYDANMVEFEEPFTVFRAHGLITKGGAKMSKSKGNVVEPDKYFNVYGADAMRMYLAFLAPFTDGGDFRDSGIAGLTRFLGRVENISKKVSKNSKNSLDENSERTVHRAIKKIGEDIENLRYNTAISELMTLSSKLEGLGAMPMDAFKVFLKLLAPFAPFVSEELYQNLAPRKNFSKKDSIHLQPWPGYDPKKIEEREFDLVIQVNGKLRGTLRVPRGIGQKKAEALAKSIENVQKYLDAGAARKVVFVPDRLLNFVV